MKDKREILGENGLESETEYKPRLIILTLHFLKGIGINFG